ncbi:MAG: VWA domain-containing protein [Devosia sp.]
MIFLWPFMLGLLALLPVLVVLYILVLRRKKRGAVRFANLAMVKAAIGKSAGWRRHVPPALFLLALAVLIVATARPAAEITLNAARSTVILAMDISGSMGAEDVMPNRLVASQEAAKRFIADQPSTVEIGIVAFASVALLVQSPTTDRESLYAAIDNFELRRGTAVGSGILTSLRTIFPEVNFYRGIAGGEGGLMNPGLALDSSPPDNNDPFIVKETEDRIEHTPVEPGSYDNAIIILLTDGATTAGPDPIAAGELAAEFGVRVFTVAFGSKEGSIVNFAGRSMRAELDAPTLQEIAKRTAGEYFAAASADELARVYSTMSTKFVGEKKEAEIAFIFAGIGALIAMFAAFLSLWWFGRVA